VAFVNTAVCISQVITEFAVRSEAIHINMFVFFVYSKSNKSYVQQAKDISRYNNIKRKLLNSNTNIFFNRWKPHELYQQIYTTNNH